MSRCPRPRSHSGSSRTAGFVACIGVIGALAASGPATIGGLDDSERRPSSLGPELRSPDFQLPGSSAGVRVIEEAAHADMAVSVHDLAPAAVAERRSRTLGERPR